MKEFSLVGYFTLSVVHSIRFKKFVCCNATTLGKKINAIKNICFVFNKVFLS